MPRVPLVTRTASSFISFQGFNSQASILSPSPPSLRLNFISRAVLLPLTNCPLTFLHQQCFHSTAPPSTAFPLPPPAPAPPSSSHRSTYRPPSTPLTPTAPHLPLCSVAPPGCRRSSWTPFSPCCPWWARPQEVSVDPSLQIKPASQTSVTIHNKYLNYYMTNYFLLSILFS